MAPLLHLLFGAERELGQQLKLLGNFERNAYVRQVCLSSAFHPLVKGAKLWGRVRQGD